MFVKAKWLGAARCSGMSFGSLTFLHGGRYVSGWAAPGLGKRLDRYLGLALQDGPPENQRFWVTFPINKVF